MRGEKEVVIPRRIATLCVLVINPLLSYVFGIVLRYGIWGIWISIAIDQVIWFICTRVCYKKFLDDKMK
jgi:Na+-driven multidrug efflux pump